MANVARYDRSEVIALLKSSHGDDTAEASLDGLVNEANVALASLDDDSKAALVRYRVPRVTEDGTCSNPKDLLPVPFDLLSSIYDKSLDDDSSDTRAILKRQWVLSSFVKELAQRTTADWVGVYRRVPSPQVPGQLALCKEAYVGAPSRPLFPLTEDFAENSNNSTVGLSGKAILISDTRKLDDDTPYYVCDGSVRAEFCVPIFGPGNDVIGIIDAEAFKPGHFTPERALTVLAFAEALGRRGLLVDMLNA